MVGALNAQQQLPTRFDMLRHLRQTLPIGFFLCNVADQKGFFVTIDHKVPHAAVGKSQVIALV